jgi:proteasome assembly chaperone (PAC2) family protein
MNSQLELSDYAETTENYMIAGWRQWADAGGTSSGLPQYLIDHLNARQIGHINPDGFYLFQFPGTHHLLRPTITLKDGYRQSLSARKNEFYYWANGPKGLIIFLGDEPHMNESAYAAAFFEAAEALHVKRIMAMGGVYGAMPYNRDREISCVVSLPAMKTDLAEYAVKFSDYEGGSTIGTYLVDQAEARGLEMVDFYAFVPAYDFTQLSAILSGIRLENDTKAWYDLLRRVNHMVDLGLDLADLQQQSSELLTAVEAKIDELQAKAPQLKVREYLEELSRNFKEMPFLPLDDVWERELGDFFEHLDD